MNKLPESPEEMPLAFHNGDDQSFRNCLMSLDNFPAVSINWEMDASETNASGEPRGEWVVEIYTNRKTFSAKHSRLTNAIWFAYTLADAANSDEYERREKARSEALSKLTPEEQILLGLA